MTHSYQKGSVIWHILHNLIQCNANGESVALVKQSVPKRKKWDIFFVTFKPRQKNLPRLLLWVIGFSFAWGSWS